MTPAFCMRESARLPLGQLPSRHAVCAVLQAAVAARKASPEAIAAARCAALGLTAVLLGRNAESQGSAEHKGQLKGPGAEGLFQHQHEGACAWCCRAKEEDEARAAAEVPTHESNEWCIEVVPHDVQVGSNQQAASTAEQQLAEGLQFSMPAQQSVDAATLQAQGVGKVEAGVEDLMSQLSSLNKRK